MPVSRTAVSFYSENKISLSLVYNLFDYRIESECHFQQYGIKLFRPSNVEARFSLLNVHIATVDRMHMAVG